ncbi:MAG TPA: arginine repressor [Chloroflexota bacterium]|jgi:transcriptional regulator of arginine metabolism
MKSDAKLARQRIIRGLVAAGDMHTQEDLVEALRREGTTVTQATISRDMVEIGLVRAIQNGKVVYTLPEAVNQNDSAQARRRLARIVREVPLAFGDSSSLLVVRTSPGMANSVCITLDACAFDEVVGTVAGDDTIFIALRSASDRERVRGHLTEVGLAVN